MKTWRWTLLFVASGGLAFACTVDSKDNDDAGTSEQTTAAATTGAGGSTVSTSGTMAAPASNTSGPMGCDSGAMGTFDVNAPPCSTCVQCALQGACADEFALCQWFIGMPEAGAPCDDFEGCRVACIESSDANMNMVIDMGAETTAFEACIGDENTPASCVGMNVMGSDQWTAFVSCWACVECLNNCDGASVCTST